MLKRPALVKGNTATPPPIELEVLDVTRLRMLLDTGVPLEFDMEKADSYTINDGFSEVRIGPRTFHIATPRILYFEVGPGQIKRPVKPITSEQLAALQK